MTYSKSILLADNNFGSAQLGGISADFSQDQLCGCGHLMVQLGLDDPRWPQSCIWQFAGCCLSVLTFFHMVSHPPESQTMILHIMQTCSNRPRTEKVITLKVQCQNSPNITFTTVNLKVSPDTRNIEVDSINCGRNRIVTLQGIRYWAVRFTRVQVNILSQEFK